MSCTSALWRRQHHFRTIRRFALTGGTLLFGLMGLIHFLAVKFAPDVVGSTPEEAESQIIFISMFLKLLFELTVRIAPNITTTLKRIWSPAINWKPYFTIGSGGTACHRPCHRHCFVTMSSPCTLVTRSPDGCMTARNLTLSWLPVGWTNGRVLICGQ